MSIFSHALIITDASVKNNIATSITYVYIHNIFITKTLHHMVNTTSTEAKLFTIRCSINQAINSTDISKIIVITDSIHAARKIFDLLSHLFQIYTVNILKELHVFFSHSWWNLIEFWECFSRYQEYSMKYIYSTSQMSKLSLTLRTFSITGSVAGLFLT